MDLILAYLAGLLTLINPCVLPVLPIVLAGALGASPRGPVALAAGMSLSFVVLGLAISSIGPLIGLTPEMLADAGAVMMIVFGTILLVPRLSAGFATATAGFSSRADAGLDGINRDGLTGQFTAGLLLGAVWSPCIGPTLGGAISLASQGQNLIWAGAIMTAFAAGVSTIILALGYGAKTAIRRRQAAMQRLASTARPIMGGVFVAVGVALLLRLHHLAEIWAIQNLPPWLIDLSVKF